MRISDWSSDVCSSDLVIMAGAQEGGDPFLALLRVWPFQRIGADALAAGEAVGGGPAFPFRLGLGFLPVGLRYAVGAQGFRDPAGPIAAAAERAAFHHRIDRKSVVLGKRVSVSVYVGGRRILKKKNTKKKKQ